VLTRPALFRLLLEAFAFFPAWTGDPAIFPTLSLESGTVPGLW
jgi:hypothetical protein